MGDTIQFVRKPFIVEAEEVTLDNIEEIARLVGELREQNGKPFIQVNRNVVPGVYRVHPGYWMTRMGDNIRCYNRRVFAQQFCLNTPEIEEWVKYIRIAGEEDNNDREVGEFGRIVEPEAPEVPEEVASEPEEPAPEHTIEVVTNASNGS